jgi:hypothetical protein
VPHEYFTAVSHSGYIIFFIHGFPLLAFLQKCQWFQDIWFTLSTQEDSLVQRKENFPISVCKKIAAD